MLVILAFFWGSTRGPSGVAAKDEIQLVQQNGRELKAPNFTDSLPPRRKSNTRSIRSQSGEETDIEVLRSNGLALFEQFKEDDSPFEYLDSMQAQERRDAIRGVLLSKVAAYEDFPPNLMYLLAKHDFNGLSDETLEGIFTWLVVDRLTDKTATRDEAIRRLSEAKLLLVTP